ncbi:hypothetical protein NQ314_019355 [Rhamnusium bicolor]|uniref:Uncharacterized protein n=1 Tax=Rhamnusium bicolor TaxID=1586634 RepID=A0AAV8WNW5_9CUCU|nr:hypothetical protein NQ314_019355 [Rhamnusium bicolor]
MNVAVMAFQDNLDGNNPRYQRNAGRHSNHSKTRNKDHNTNSSASRIRSWQLFYGAIESTSTTSRSSSSTSDKDCNSNKSNNRPSKSSFKDQNLDVNTLTRPPRSQNSLDSHERYISTIKDVSSKIVSDGSIYYHGYPDVAEDIDANNDRTDSVVSPVRSRLPWSYFQAVEKEYSREYCSSDIPVRHYNRFKMTHEYESYTKSRTDNWEAMVKLGWVDKLTKHNLLEYLQNTPHLVSTSRNLTKLANCSRKTGRHNEGRKIPKKKFSTLIGEIWEDLKPEIICHSFRKGVIFSYNSSVVTKEQYDPLAYKRWEEYNKEQTDNAENNAHSEPPAEQETQPGTSEKNPRHRKRLDIIEDEISDKDEIIYDDTDEDIEEEIIKHELLNEDMIEIAKITEDTEIEAWILIVFATKKS